jgi:hypothetical protein
MIGMGATVSRGLSVVLVIGFGLMTVLAVSGRWTAGIGGVVMLFGGAMLYELLRRRSEYVATGLGLLWLGLCLAGLVVFLWGWL